MRETVRVPLDVMQVLPGDHLAVVVKMLLDAAEEPITQRELAEYCAVDRGTVRRAMTRLADAGLIERPKRGPKRCTHAPSDGAPARAINPRDGALARAMPGSDGAPARAIGDEDEGLSSSSSNELFPSGIAAASAAVKVPNPAVETVRAAWHQLDPKPVMAFGRIVKIAQRFLDAGWSSEDVTAALVASPTIGEGWLESWLRRNRRRGASPAVDEQARRDAPTGRIKL